MIEIVVIGIIVSIIFYEITGISPGGLIVPGFLVLYISEVDRIIYTLLISVITVFVIRLLSKYVLLHGKRRFAVTILVSIFINIVIAFILKSISISLLDVSIVGITISGLMANEMYKQSIRKTIPATIIVVVFLQMIILIAKGVGMA